MGPCSESQLSPQAPGSACTANDSEREGLCHHSHPTLGSILQVSAPVLTPANFLEQTWIALPSSLGAQRGSQKNAFSA